MSMSDCIKCWEAPCKCGYEYRNWSKDERIRLAGVILGIPNEKGAELLNDVTPDKHPKKEK
jgi:hypothetical protein